jgi:hypothetical protein
MAGKGIRYSHFPIYFGTIPEVGVRVAFVGECDSSLETHGFWWRGTAR